MTRPAAVLAGPPADAHTWNLIYLEMLLEENGYSVTNLGPNVHHDTLFETLSYASHDLVVISCLNGSIKQEGLALMQKRTTHGIGEELFVIGGVLHEEEDTPEVRQHLQQAGFTDVFINEPDATRFTRFLTSFKAHRRGFLTAL